MNKLILSSILTLVISGCAARHVPMDWQATGGSRGDGTVKLSVQYGYAVPQLNENQALSLAVQRCAAWGYTGAEAFGGTTSVCNQFDKYLGCIDNILTKEYQCTTEKNAVPH